MAFIVAAILAPQFAVAANEKSNPRIAELQRNLNELGYNTGAVDGKLGEQTRKAIIQFEKDHNLGVTGKYSGILLFKTETEVKAAQRRATPKGQKREKEKKRLLSMTNVELVKLIENSDDKKAEEVLNLIGERANELPIKVLSKLFGGQKFWDFIIFTALRTLYYPGSDEGVKMFQKDIGAKVTGDLTFGQFQQLQRRSSRFKDTPVYASSTGDHLNIFAHDNYISVEGTWVLEGENIAYPINQAKIICIRSNGECQVIQVDIVVPTLKDSNDGYNIVLDANYYSIISWDDDEVLASDKGRCRTSMLTINNNSNEVIEVTRNNETKECREGYLTLPNLDKPRIARLVPGWKRTYNWWKQRQKDVSEYVNSRYRSKMKEFIKEIESTDK